MGQVVQREEGSEGHRDLLGCIGRLEDLALLRSSGDRHLPARCDRDGLGKDDREKAGGEQEARDESDDDNEEDDLLPEVLVVLASVEQLRVTDLAVAVGV